MAYGKVTVSRVSTTPEESDRSIWVVEDVTERKLAEELFRTLADSIPQLCWIADPHGQIVWYNRRWVDYTGMTLEDLWGKRLLPVLDADVQPRALEQWTESIASGQPFEMELPIRRTDGAYRPFLTRVQPVRDERGRAAWWCGTHTDIGDLRQAEAALRESERVHRIVADNTYDFEFWRAPDGRYLYVSPSCERVTGYKPAELLADQDLLPRLVHPEDRSRFDERMRALTADRLSVEFEFRIVHRDGTDRWLAQACQPVFSERGEYLGLRGSNREVTDRKRAEEALREADRRKDEFLATLAHELRNPLAPIRNGLQVLRLSPDQQTCEQAVTMMQRQVDRIVRLVEDLLDVSRISAGKLDLRKEPVPLREIVRDAVESSQPLIDSMGHKLTVTLPDHPLTVDADFARLAQVISNLLNNSAKYTDRGGHIWLTAERQGREVLISVKDDGIGIAADQLPGLFRMYSQVRSSLERSQGGMGIGLTLAKRLVEMHGGGIEARSDGPGKGSEFLVRLPLLEEESLRPARAGMDKPTGPKSSLRVLIVDDNRDAGESLAMLLRVLGHDVRTAPDGQEGLAEAEAFRPDVALVDIGLPKLDGYEVSRRIREQAWGQAMVLVALTGWGQEEDRGRSRDAGFDEHLFKPVHPNALMRMLAELPKAKT
jgi:PAS domain S-box-containing protein